MVIKKENSMVVDMQLTQYETYQLKNYSKHIVDHITLELTKDVFFIFCYATKEGLIRFNNRLLFIGELEQTIRQEQNTNNNITIKYCCNNSNKVGRIISNKCLILPMFNNKQIGYNYHNNIFSCYNIA